MKSVLLYIVSPVALLMSGLLIMAGQDKPGGIMALVAGVSTAIGQGMR